MGQLRLVVVLSCLVLVGGLAGCSQGLPQPFLSPLSPSPTSSLATFDSPVGAADSPVAQPTAPLGVRPSEISAQIRLTFQVFRFTIPIPNSGSIFLWASGWRQERWWRYTAGSARHLPKEGSFGLKTPYGPEEARMFCS
jgi:hypothetical protein